MDLKSSILATARRGNNLPGSVTEWDGDASDCTAGAVCAMVRAGEPEIILQGKGNLEKTVRESGVMISHYSMIRKRLLFKDEKGKNRSG